MAPDFSDFFKFLYYVVQVYYYVCIFRIVMSWIPSLMYTTFGKLIFAITEPFFKIFRKIPLRIGVLDLSPILAFFCLSALIAILQDAAQYGYLTFHRILAVLVSMFFYNFIFPVLVFFLILLIIRIVVMASNHNKNYYNSPWYAVDNFLSKIVYKFTKIFSGRGRMIPYGRALTIFTIELILVMAVLYISVNRLIYVILNYIPF